MNKNDLIKKWKKELKELTDKDEIELLEEAIADLEYEQMSERDLKGDL